MKTINDSLKKLSNDIHYDKEVLKNRITAILNYIKTNLNIKFEKEHIGSHRQNTEIKLTNNKYDIDVALIFEGINNQEVIQMKKKIHSILVDYRDELITNPTVRWRSYAIALDFSGDETNREYHFDFTIYNENRDVVKGKQNEELFIETAGTFDLIKRIDNLSLDQKNTFETLVRLLKHWNKNGKGKNFDSIPSIVFTDEVLKFIEIDWNGSNDILINLKIILEKILKAGLNSWKFSVAPFDNPFQRNTDNQNIESKRKIEDLIFGLNSSINETNSEKKYQILKEYFKGLEAPKDDTDPEDVKYGRITKNQGA